MVIINKTSKNYANIEMGLNNTDKLKSRSSHTKYNLRHLQEYNQDKLIEPRGEIMIENELFFFYIFCIFMFYGVTICIIFLVKWIKK